MSIEKNENFMMETSKSLIKYVKHDRDIPNEVKLQNEVIGGINLATHDIHGSMLVAYEIEGISKDKIGTQFEMNEELINKALTASNEDIKKRFFPVHKHITTFFKGGIDEAEMLPIILNHKIDSVENTVGRTKGLFYTKIIKGTKCLMINVVIKDLEAKKKIIAGLYRGISATIRRDGSVSDISFVISPALPDACFMLSEQDSNSININPLSLSEEEIQLSEEVMGLQLSEQEFTNVIIPNHLLITKMIKDGKIKPSAYDKLIKSTHTTLQLMDQCAVKNDLSAMYGIGRHPEKIDKDKKIALDAINKASKEINQLDKKNNKNITKHQQDIKPEQELEMIQLGSFEDNRKKELKLILELSEYDVETTKKYIKYELGIQEAIDNNINYDINLAEYINKSKLIKSRLDQIKNNSNIKSKGDFKHDTH